MQIPATFPWFKPQREREWEWEREGEKKLKKVDIQIRRCITICNEIHQNAIKYSENDSVVFASKITAFNDKKIVSNLAPKPSYLFTWKIIFAP